MKDRHLPELPILCTPVVGGDAEPQIASDRQVSFSKVGPACKAVRHRGRPTAAVRHTLRETGDRPDRPAGAMGRKRSDR
jgi:hypothetical protein